MKASSGHPPPKPCEWWAKGMVACYHPIDKRIDMGMGMQKCGVCLYWREKIEDWWPPSRPPRESDSS